MPKASIKLLDGTVVTIEGSEQEVRRLLAQYGGSGKSQQSSPRARPPKRGNRSQQEAPGGGADLAAIVSQVKSCDEAEAIENNILDRSSQTDRTLLPLYIVHQYMDNRTGLTSGEISTVTKELGIPISQPNCSKTLSGIASKYVVGDKVRKKGMPVRYKLSRRGVHYVKSLIDRQGHKQ